MICGDVIGRIPARIAGKKKYIYYIILMNVPVHPVISVHFMSIASKIVSARSKMSLKGHVLISPRKPLVTRQ